MKHRGAARSSNGARRTTINAYNIGLTHDEATGDVQAYIAHLYARNRSNGKKYPTIRIYGEHVYIFEGRALITSYQLPDEIREQALEQYRQKKDRILQDRIEDDRRRLERIKSVGYMGNVTIDENFAY